jgi:hypothetical protein
MPSLSSYAKAGEWVGYHMHEFKHGTLHSGSKKGPKVKSRAQAIAIGLSVQRRKSGQDAAILGDGGYGSGQDNAILGNHGHFLGGHAGFGR